MIDGLSPFPGERKNCANHEYAKPQPHPCELPNLRAVYDVHWRGNRAR